MSFISCTPNKAIHGGDKVTVALFLSQLAIKQTAGVLWK